MVPDIREPPASSASERPHARNAQHMPTWTANRETPWPSIRPREGKVRSERSRATAMTRACGKSPTSNPPSNNTPATESGTVKRPPGVRSERNDRVENSRTPGVFNHPDTRTRRHNRQTKPPNDEITSPLTMRTTCSITAAAVAIETTSTSRKRSCECHVLITATKH